MSIIKAKVLAFWLPFYKEAIFYFETQIQVPDGSWQHVSFEVNWLGFKTRSYSTDVVELIVMPRYSANRHNSLCV